MHIFTVKHAVKSYVLLWKCTCLKLYPATCKCFTGDRDLPLLFWFIRAIKHCSKIKEQYKLKTSYLHLTVSYFFPEVLKQILLTLSFQILKHTKRKRSVPYFLVTLSNYVNFWGIFQPSSGESCFCAFPPVHFRM